MARRVSHCRSTVALIFKSDMCLLIYSLQIFSSLLLYPSLIDSEGVPIYVYQNLVSWPSSLVNNNPYIYLSVCLKRKFVYKYFSTKDKLITAYVSSYYPLPKKIIHYQILCAYPWNCALGIELSRALVCSFSYLFYVTKKDFALISNV